VHQIFIDVYHYLSITLPKVDLLFAQPIRINFRSRRVGGDRFDKVEQPTGDAERPIGGTSVAFERECHTGLIRSN
jgi:hypothetical protein